MLLLLLERMRNEVTKVDDKFYCRLEFPQAGIDAEIFAVDEEHYSSAPIAASIYVKAVI